jgi:hypothetical protein
MPTKKTQIRRSRFNCPVRPVTIADKDGDDAKLYLEKEVKQRLKKLEDLK